MYPKENKSMFFRGKQPWRGGRGRGRGYADSAQLQQQLQPFVVANQPQPLGDPSNDFRVIDGNLYRKRGENLLLIGRVLPETAQQNAVAQQASSSGSLLGTALMETDPLANMQSVPGANAMLAQGLMGNAPQPMAADAAIPPGYGLVPLGQIAQSSSDVVDQQPHKYYRGGDSDFSTRGQLRGNSRNRSGRTRGRGNKRDNTEPGTRAHRLLDEDEEAILVNQMVQQAMKEIKKKRPASAAQDNPIQGNEENKEEAKFSYHPLPFKLEELPGKIIPNEHQGKVSLANFDVENEGLWPVMAHLVHTRPYQPGIDPVPEQPMVPPIDQAGYACATLLTIRKHLKGCQFPPWQVIPGQGNPTTSNGTFAPADIIGHVGGKFPPAYMWCAYFPSEQAYAEATEVGNAPTPQDMKEAVREEQRLFWMDIRRYVVQIALMSFTDAECQSENLPILWACHQWDPRAIIDASVFEPFALNMDLKRQILKEAKSIKDQVAFDLFSSAKYAEWSAQKSTALFQAAMEAAAKAVAFAAQSQARPAAQAANPNAGVPAPALAPATAQQAQQ